MSFHVEVSRDGTSVRPIIGENRLSVDFQSLLIGFVSIGSKNFYM